MKYKIGDVLISSAGEPPTKFTIVGTQTDAAGVLNYVLSYPNGTVISIATEDIDNNSSWSKEGLNKTWLWIGVGVVAVLGVMMLSKRR